ncbi:hypothetical protein [Rickettsiales endosymbiont of Stachyamoeba lipophora]|uniref:hypothetical protein n=1 Tax=Rickettsiales endosymbiont of Stachyamoeba lipophora TaxID=2486578 RepID=UPI000F648F99|nr:hypothetical protein [Rickettsiales endosymbiont of Stachyamoeba lipophora]AZL15060.1 hypothetical protein EF513_00570 [Rickettsiales endosymbiont of Stachyamoeba lipophora]
MKQKLISTLKNKIEFINQFIFSIEEDDILNLEEKYQLSAIQDPAKKSLAIQENVLHYKSAELTTEADNQQLIKEVTSLYIKEQTRKEYTNRIAINRNLHFAIATILKSKNDSPKLKNINFNPIACKDHLLPHIINSTKEIALDSNKKLELNLLIYDELDHVNLCIIRKLGDQINIFAMDSANQTCFNNLNRRIIRYLSQQNDPNIKYHPFLTYGYLQYDNGSCFYFALSQLRILSQLSDETLIRIFSNTKEKHTKVTNALSPIAELIKNIKKSRDSAPFKANDIQIKKDQYQPHFLELLEHIHNTLIEMETISRSNNSNIEQTYGDILPKTIKKLQQNILDFISNDNTQDGYKWRELYRFIHHLKVTLQKDKTAAQAQLLSARDTFGQIPELLKNIQSYSELNKHSKPAKLQDKIIKKQVIIAQGDNSHSRIRNYLIYSENQTRSFNLLKTGITQKKSTESGQDFYLAYHAQNHTITYAKKRILEKALKVAESVTETEIEDMINDYVIYQESGLLQNISNIIKERVSTASDYFKDDYKYITKKYITKDELSQPTQTDNFLLESERQENQVQQLAQTEKNHHIAISKPRLLANLNSITSHKNHTYCI